MIVWIGLMTRLFVSQRRLRRRLRGLASELNWRELKKPWIAASEVVTGVWNGHGVGFHYWAPGKGTPAFVAADLEVPLSGRFELRCRPKSGFWNRTFSLFRPPTIQLFDPQDEQFRAWGDDRTLVDRLLSLPGVRPALAIHLCGGDAVLTLRKGRLRIRRPIPRHKTFDFGDEERTIEMARAEWDLISAAERLL